MSCGLDTRVPKDLCFTCKYLLRYLVKSIAIRSQLKLLLCETKLTSLCKQDGSGVLHNVMISPTNICIVVGVTRSSHEHLDLFYRSTCLIQTWEA